MSEIGKYLEKIGENVKKIESKEENVEIYSLNKKILLKVEKRYVNIAQNKNKGDLKGEYKITVEIPTKYNNELGRKIAQEYRNEKTNICEFYVSKENDVKEYLIPFLIQAVNMHRKTINVSI